MVSVLILCRSAMPSNDRRDSKWLCDFVGRLQVLAGTFSDDVAPIGVARDLLDSVPPELNIRNRLAISYLTSTVLARVVSDCGADMDPRALNAYFRVASNLPGSTSWRAGLNDFLDLFSPDQSIQGLHADVRMREALRYIERHRRDRNLRLADVAVHVRLSPFYLTRCLKRATGCSFDALLQRARIGDARRLLEQTPLMIKEIAVTVGYESSTQFGRHFKRLTGTTARSYQR